MLLKGSGVSSGCVLQGIGRLSMLWLLLEDVDGKGTVVHRRRGGAGTTLYESHSRLIGGLQAASWQGPTLDWAVMAESPSARAASNNAAVGDLEA